MKKGNVKLVKDGEVLGDVVEKELVGARNRPNLSVQISPIAQKRDQTAKWYSQLKDEQKYSDEQEELLGEFILIVIV